MIKSQEQSANSKLKKLIVLKPQMDHGASPRPVIEGLAPRSLAEKSGHRTIVGLIDKRIIEGLR